MMTYNFDVKRMTHGPRHHFFGYHDLAITSQKSGRALFLAVDDMRSPPEPDDFASVCVMDPDDPTSLREITKTSTFNYPQGARQQWVGDTDNFIVNQAVGTQTVSRIYESGSGKKLTQLERGCNAAGREGRKIYSIDFGRAHRLAGYGYSGIKDETPNDPAPKNNGVFVTDVETNKSELILNIAEVVERNGYACGSDSFHFFTHMCLNPKGDRLAFLHRFRLPDGGEQTCLMTVGTKGENFRVLVQGMFSHFDWKDDSTLLIWGRRNGTVASVRNSPLLKIPLFAASLRLAKAPLRKVIGSSAIMQAHFHLVKDADPTTTEVCPPEALRVDGHPMVNPKNRDWIINDTYPDEKGIRDLYLFRFSDGQRIDIGQFKMSDETSTAEVIAKAKPRLKDQIDVGLNFERYIYTQSGLHCDLHPRWFADGNRGAFDSIHEGDRQIYMVDVSHVIPDS